jgi:Putative amidase domain
MKVGNGMRIRNIASLKTVVIAVIFFGTAIEGGGVAFAYSGASAASYAEKWVSPYNGLYNAFGNDCTNFVTQAMVNGGFPVTRGYYTNSNLFFNDTLSNFQNLYVSDGRSESVTATVAQNLYNYLMTYGKGSFVGQYNALNNGSAPSYLPSGMVNGDILLYDWTSSGTFNHASMQVTTGTDPNSGFIGTLVDQHTSDRKHAFWSLKPYNSNWQYTNIAFIHITG